MVLYPSICVEDETGGHEGCGRHCIVPLVCGGEGDKKKRKKGKRIERGKLGM